jgi:hypothetical protein
MTELEDIQVTMLAVILLTVNAVSIIMTIRVVTAVGTMLGIME